MLRSARAIVFVWVVVFIGRLLCPVIPDGRFHSRMAGLLARGSLCVFDLLPGFPVVSVEHSPLTVAGAAVAFGLLLGSAGTTFPFDPALWLGRSAMNHA